MNLFPSRRDRINLVDYHVGAIHFRGCEWGCCPYDRQSRGSTELRERYGYNDAMRIQAWKGRAECINPYKPKLICIDCRRTFKYTVVEGDEYHSDNYGRNMEVRPIRERILNVWAKYISNVVECKTHVMELTELENKEVIYRSQGEAVFGKAELEELREQSPELRWCSPKGLRCPGCGKEGQTIGNTFRAPRKDDMTGWSKVWHMLDAGERFSYCMTPQEEQEVAKEGIRDRTRKRDKGMWEE